MYHYLFIIIFFSLSVESSPCSHFPLCKLSCTQYLPQHRLEQCEVLLLRGFDDGKREDESYGEDAEEQREDALRYVVDLLGKPLPVAGVRGDKQLRTPEPGEDGGCGPSLVALQPVVEGGVGRLLLLLLLGDGVGRGGAGSSRRLDVGVGEHPATVGLQKKENTSGYLSKIQQALLKQSHKFSTEMV